MALWYHFAIMFEALFILTTLDAGTRVGRFMLQDFLGQLLGAARTHELVSVRAAVERDDGRRVGLLSLSRGGRPARRHQQPVAALRHLEPAARRDRAVRRQPPSCSRTGGRSTPGRHSLRSPGCSPSTMTAGYQKIFSADLRIGFLAEAAQRSQQARCGRPPAEEVVKLERLIFNDYLDAAITGVFMVLVVDRRRRFGARLVRGDEPAERRLDPRLRARPVIFHFQPQAPVRSFSGWPRSDRPPVFAEQTSRRIRVRVPAWLIVPPTASRKRRARIFSSMPTIPWTGIPGAPKRSRPRAGKASPCCCRSATRPVTGAT